ncbi:DUF3450 domain-containing protein [Marinicellulosiphila megalodicopiae]|uniref:DUF3450 domain-containing protein n=1 Tax=Marinicellulosiphila megalodicopiae TaxID=2724896 RepID=UPI003BB18292
MKLRNALLAASISIASTPLFAQVEPAQIMTEIEKNIKDSQQSQVKIDTLNQSTLALFQKFQSELKLVEGLQVYNVQLTEQVNAQQQDINILDESIDKVTHIERQLMPLMLRMIKALESFVILDLPFSLKERNERIVFLEEAMINPEITVSEKLRQVLEAYQVEMQYGSMIEAYQDNITVNSQNLEVDILRIGRTALYFQTLDKKQSGIWNVQDKKWTTVSDDFNNTIRDGIRIARNQLPASLMMLPVAAVKEQ